METKITNFKKHVLSLLHLNGIPNQREFAFLIGISPQHMNSVLNGRDKPGRELLEKMATALKVKVSDLVLFTEGSEAKHETANEEYIPVPLIAPNTGGALAPSVGARGSLVFRDAARRVKSYLAMREDWLYLKGDPGYMAVTRASKDMCLPPTIPVGSLVLIDWTQKELVDGRIYLVAFKGKDFLGRMTVSNGTWTMESNPEVKGKAGDAPPYAVVEFNVLGLALWYGCEL